MSEMTNDELTKKLRQHEETITQLVEIVAATNQRLSELDKKVSERTHPVSLT
ncbi:hypothetical protein [Virgibacillus siamensis]|uniref:hypothetical protein n=1 Tax=Virgibacillus siamensis TaxID=480071 RepID=UPI00158C1315|nr:hypothetical protein [Virgibacillus siamensis]